MLGQKVVYHDAEHGDMVGWLVDEEGGMVAGFTNSKAKSAGAGDVFRRNATKGTDPGQYSTRK